MKKILIGVVVLLVLAVGWFFMFFTKTPLYSLGMAGYAYYKKDYPMFEKYVDVPTVAVNGYDDLAPIYLNEKTKAVKKKAANVVSNAIGNILGTKAGAAVAKSLGEKVANEVVDGAVASIEPAVKAKLVDGVTKKVKTFFTELDEDKVKADSVKEETPGKLSLKSISEESNLNGVAIMKAVLGNQRNEVLPVRLRMLQKQDKEWKVIKVENLNEVITKGPEFIE